jgi:hypothetical protein
VEQTLTINQVAIRRDNVDAIRSDIHPFLNLVNRHVCVALYQGTEDALVFWVQVLYYYKGYAGIDVFGKT